MVEVQFFFNSCVEAGASRTLQPLKMQLWYMAASVGFTFSNSATYNSAHFCLDILL